MMCGWVWSFVGSSLLQDAEKYKAKVSSLNVSLAEILHKFPGFVSG